MFGFRLHPGEEVVCRVHEARTGSLGMPPGCAPACPAQQRMMSRTAFHDEAFPDCAHSHYQYARLHIQFFLGCAQTNPYPATRFALHLELLEPADLRPWMCVPCPALLYAE